VLPFNKRPGRDAGESSDADSSQQRRSVPPPARSQPRLEEKPAPAPARAFQPSLSDEEVTMFMPSPAKKSPKAALAESGETRTSAKKHIRPPAPSIVDEDEDEGRTQIRPMPKGGKLSLPTSSISVAKVREREPASEPPPARKDVRGPEISLPKSSAVMSELDMHSMDAGANAPNFTMQLGPSGQSSAPPPMKSSPPPAMPQMSTHQFAPAPAAPVRSQPPAMAAPAMMGQMGQMGQGSMSNMGASSGMLAPGPMQMAPMGGPMGAPMSPAMMSGQVQAMSPGMMAGMSGQLPAMSLSHQQPSMGGMSGGFPQQHASMSGGYAAVSGQFPGSPLSDPRLDPPGTAVSLSGAAPKPARVWVMAFAAVSTAAAIAVFGLTKGSSGAQKTTAAFVDPSQPPGEPAPGATPLGTTAPAAPQASAPAIAQGGPAPGPTPADLLAQPPVSGSAPTPATGAGIVAAPATPAVGVAQPAAVAVTPPSGAVGTPPAKPAAPAAAAPPVKPETPKVVKVAAAPAEPKVAATPKPPKPAPPKPEEAPKKTPSPADKEMKDAADALARAQLEQSL
jgi:hypothetical protein